MAIEGFRRVHRVGELPAIDQENVEQPVVVVVEERHAAAHRFDQIFLRRGRIHVAEIQAARMPHVKKRLGHRQAHGGERFEEVASCDPAHSILRGLL